MSTRDPVDLDVVRRHARSAEHWQLQTVRSTGSTNSDLAARRSGAGRQVLLAEEQVAGRGRQGRTWSAPRGASLILSVRLEPHRVPLARRGWIGAILGLAAIEAIRRTTGQQVNLKWPNDLLLGEAKLAGILAESAGADALVVGIGLNVSVRADEFAARPAGALPPTSLVLAGAEQVDRSRLAAAVLDALHDRLVRWEAAGGDLAAAGLRAEYLSHCVTLGRPVRVLLPGGGELLGSAQTVTEGGALVVTDADGRRSEHSAADVVHLRHR